MDSRSSIDSSTMMLDWNEQDQIGGTLWPDLMVSEDHIVPYPIESEVYALFPSGDYNTNKKNEAVTADVWSTEQSSRANNEDLSYKSEGRSSFHTGQELSSSRTEMDPWWFDFPNLCIELGDDYPDGNSHSSVTELMNDLSDASNLNSWRGDSMQLDCEPELLGLDDKQNGDILDCDWDAFGDFDDIENLFRKNDTLSGHDMIGSDDGFLSPSKDVISSAAQSIPLPDLPLCNDQTSNEGCSSVQLDGHSEKQQSPLRNGKDLPLCNDQTSNEGCSSVQLDGHSEKQQSPLRNGKVDGQKIIRVSENKAEVRRMNRPNYNDPQLMPSTNVQTFQSDLINQQAYGDAKLMEHHGSSNQVSFTQHGYPIYCFSGMQLPPDFHIDCNQKRPVSSSYEVCLDDAKHKKPSNKVLDSKPTIMTPQEKMEKLRRLQKMQAQLAIEQQHQQFTHIQSNQVLDSVTSTTGTVECAQRVSSSELNMLSEKDESKGTSSLTHDSTLEETVYYQLQEVVEKLDMRVRLRIRDSLLRLARSAMERQSVTDRSSTNKNSKDEDEVSADEELRDPEKSTTLADSETDTNPIDRIVANLLFQGTTEACPRTSSYELLG